ncbi:flagellar basal body-associated FliL family protein [Planctomicrobium sp. SH527]|uniref:flagellar basal body-associated FliL family protein n=1 Tax=Planctomicrobium sp. SH527 TaxID=3448123 RepID=UPI003F5C8B6B
MNRIPLMVRQEVFNVQECDMADQTSGSEGTAGAAKASSGGIVPWIIVGLISCVVGSLVPFAMAMLNAPAAAHGTDGSEDGAGVDIDSGHGSGHGSSDSKSGHGSDHGKGAGGTGSSSPNKGAMAFISYGDVTVNLDEQRLNRYLRIKIVLQTRRADESAVKAAISEKELLLRNWLVSHLSDKELDEIRGKAGQNMLRREIRDYFNASLFPDHVERVYDVLFQEFNVQ